MCVTVCHVLSRFGCGMVIYRVQVDPVQVVYHVNDAYGLQIKVTTGRSQNTSFLVAQTFTHACVCNGCVIVEVFN